MQDAHNKTAEYLVCDGIELAIERPLMSDGDIRAIQTGRWEPNESALAKAALKPGDRVLEAGACLGYVSMVMARLVGPENVFAYEANPAPIDTARRNFARNGLNVELTNAILVNRQRYEGAGQSVTFYVSNAVVSSSSIGKQGRSIAVPAVCLEDEIARRGCNVLMLDIEGGEADLLCDADLRSIDKIIMETHYRKAGRAEIDGMIRALYVKGFAIDLSLARGEVIYMDRGTSSI
jgi:FkbM family methyltransferase